MAIFSISNLRIAHVFISQIRPHRFSRAEIHDRPPESGRIQRQRIKLIYLQPLHAHLIRIPVHLHILRITQILAFKHQIDPMEPFAAEPLYGKQHIYGGQNPFTATDLQMGVNEIKITDVVKIGDKYYIKGEHFNNYSKVTLNGKELETIFLGESVLGLLEAVDPKDAVNMKVSQIEKKTNEILSTTE